MCLLAWLWDVTLDLWGRQCSILLIFFTFTAALCDCTSSVVFWPFMGAFAPAMVSGLALGENLSGVVASAVSWLGFSPAGSFLVLACMLLVSGFAFRGLQRMASSQDDAERAASSEVFIAEDALDPKGPFLVIGLTSLFENAVLPSVLPYATARYSSAHYHLASTIPVGPVALLTLVYFQASRTAVLAMAGAAALVVGLITAVALGYSDPGGGAVIAYVLLAKVLVAYGKATSMYHLKVGSRQARGAQQHLETAGGLMQVWSVVGAVLMFFLVHYTKIFERP